MSATMDRLFAEAKRVIPGGVNSPVRAFGAVGGSPVFFESARGATVVDADGRSYVDYVGSWGPMIVGHAHPRVVEAIRDQAGKGCSFGAPTALETEMARRVIAKVPSCASAITASTVSGSACPKISGPQDPTRSRYRLPSTSNR